jgi:hypothetical protein
MKRKEVREEGTQRGKLSPTPCVKSRWDAVTHPCYPSYMEGRDWEDHNPKLAQAKS